MLDQHCNIAIQLLPLGVDLQIAYTLIDAAIDKIKKSGLHYVVCPFETVIEGPYAAIMEIIDEIQVDILNNPSADIIINLKIQRSNTHPVSIAEKIQPYQ